MRAFIAGLLLLMPAILATPPGEASAALLSKLSTFAISTGTAGTTQTITVGFQPKFILCMWGGSTSGTDALARGTMRRGIGFATGTTARRSISGYSADAVGTTAVARRTTDVALIEIINQATAGVDGAADLDAILSNGYRLVIDDQFPVAIQVSCLALGGDSLTNAAVGTLTMPGGTGNISVTSLAFQPNLMIMAGAEANSIPQGINANSMFSVGAALSDSQRATTAASTSGALDTSITCRYSTDVETSSIITTLTGCPINRRIDFVGFLSNGFTVNRLEWVDERINVWAALQIDNAAIGSFSTRTDTNQIAVSGLSFRPESILFFSHATSESTQDTAQAHDILSLGAATGSLDQAAHTTRDEDNVGTTIVSVGIEHDSIYINPTASAKQGSLQLTSTTSDGFTAAMDDPDPSAAFVWYLAFGPASSTWYVKAGANPSTIPPATSCEQADVATAVGLASVLEGDTVVVAGGNCTWTSNVVMGKGITLQGAGAGTPAQCAATPQSTFTCITAGSSYTGNLIQWVSFPDDATIRLTGFTLDSGSGTNIPNATTPLVSIRGVSPNIRIDHNYFAMRRGHHGTMWQYAPRGLVDNNTFENFNSESRHSAFVFNGGRWGTGTSTCTDFFEGCGDRSWAEAANFGSSNSLYFEDNTFIQVGSNISAIDGWVGARYVARFNTQTGDQTLGSHGTDSSGRTRGVRAVEQYHNVATDVAQAGIWGIRGGTGIFFGNVATGASGRIIDLTHYRLTTGPGGNCSYWYCCDDNTTINSSTNVNGDWHQGQGGLGNAPANSFDQGAGTSQGYACMDQVGRGAGDLLTGTYPTVGWPNQVLEPVVAWHNLNNGSSQNAGVNVSQSGYIESGREYVNLTTGTGTGLRSSRPSTCQAGCTASTCSPFVAPDFYWSTDGGGNWNTSTTKPASNPGEDGGLDRCTATNTWTNDWYVPLAYPHPMIGTPASVPWTEALRILVK